MRRPLVVIEDGMVEINGILLHEIDRNERKYVGSNRLEVVDQDALEVNGGSRDLLSGGGWEAATHDYIFKERNSD